MAWAVEHQKTSAWKKILKIISYSIVFQLQAHGPHVVRHNVFSGPRTRSGKILKSEICWKACEVTFVSLNWLRSLKCICTRMMNAVYYLSIYHFVLFIYFTITSEGTTPPLTLRWGTWLDNLCFSGGPVFVVLKSTSGAMNSVPTNKSVYLSAERTHLKVSSESN